jgi:hypothetical protein
MTCPFGFKKCQRDDCEMWNGKKCTADPDDPDKERD